MTLKWDTPFNSASTGDVFAGWRFANKGGSADPSTFVGIRKGPSGGRTTLTNRTDTLYNRSIAVDQFAVASFDAARTNQPVFLKSLLVSRSSMTVLSDGTDYYYCFEEWRASPAVTLQLCEDAAGTKCFYQNVQRANTNRDWTRNCPKLPSGSYKARKKASIFFIVNAVLGARDSALRQRDVRLATGEERGGIRPRCGDDGC